MISRSDPFGFPTLSPAGLLFSACFPHLPRVEESAGDEIWGKSSGFRSPLDDAAGFPGGTWPIARGRVLVLLIQGSQSATFDPIEICGRFDAVRVLWRTGGCHR